MPVDAQPESAASEGRWASFRYRDFSILQAARLINMISFQMMAVALAYEGKNVRLGFADGSTGQLPYDGYRWANRQLPGQKFHAGIIGDEGCGGGDHEQAGAKRLMRVSRGHKGCPPYLPDGWQASKRANAL